MKIILAACLLFIHAYAFAQPVGIDDSIMNVKGAWSKKEPFYPMPIDARPKKLFPVLDKKVDSIAVVFRAAYPNLKGTDAYWYSSLSEGDLYNGGPWPYAYRSAFMYYYYNKAYKKIMKTGETGTWAYAFVNRVSWLFDKAEISINVNGRENAVWLFPHEKGEWKGHALYAPVTHDNASAIILTKNGRLPYKPVTQLQYLQALRKIRDKEKQSANAAVKDDALRAKQNLFWDKELKIIDDYLSNTDKATLNQQAIVTNWRIFKGSFPTLKDKGAHKLVYVDPEYFNPNLPSYAPQFMVVYWRWNNNAPGQYFKQQFEANLKVETLKAMIQ